MRTIELTEYESWVGRLPADQLDELSLVAEKRLQIMRRLHGEAEIRATEHVGVLVTRDLTIRIRPKVPLDNLFFMLDAGAERWQLDRAAARFAQDDDLTATIVRLFAVEVERLTGRGLLHGYVEHHDRLVALRGRLDLQQLARRPWEVSPIACRFDEFVPDIFVNRVLRTALEVARPAPAIPTSLRGELHLLRQRFDGMSAEPVPVRDVDRWRPTRVDRHYSTAMGLARIILHHLTLADRHGVTAASSFTIDMNKLYEDFLGRELTKRLPAGLSLSEQQKTHLAKAGRFTKLPMQPDYLIHQAGRVDRPVYVADAKYKLTEALGSNADHYQLLAYLTRLGLPEGVLVYCQPPDDGSTAQTDAWPWSTVEILGAERLHHVYRLDVSGDRSQIAERLDALAEWLLERIGQQARSHDGLSEASTA